MALVDMDAAPVKFNFAPSLVAVCAVMLILLLAVTEYPEELTKEEVPQFYNFYIHVVIMIFVGFGYLMTFLRRYSMSAVSLNFFASAMVMVEAILCVGACQQIFWGPKRNTIVVDLPLLIDAAFAAGSSMIAFGAVLGKATPTQLLWLLFIQVPIYALNQHLIIQNIMALDVGGTIVIHAFGCYYGLAASYMLSRKQTGYGVNHAKNGSSYMTDIFSMIGTLFLWMYWPSFNGALASIIPAGEEENQAYVSAQFLAIANTVTSLLGSALSTFALSAALEGRFNAVATQNATLAGGVAMGAACTLRMAPGVAFVIGLSAGCLSTAGFKYLTPYLDAKIGLGDTCGIHNLHGMPAVMGGLVAGFLSYTQKDDYVPHTPDTQMSYQAAATFASVCIGLGGGLFSGWLVSAVNVGGAPTLVASQLFEDGVWWGGAQEEEVPEKPMPASKYVEEGPVLARRAPKYDAKGDIITISRDRSMEELVASKC